MLRAMPPLSVEERTRLGLRAAGSHMYQQDKVWSRYSNDKVDIAGALARVLRTLNKALPLDEPMRALSIGSSNEPQFRVLESAFRGGLYLLDIEDAALAVVEERIHRQNTRQVRVIHGDYHEALRDAESVLCFRRAHLDDRRMTLITLHHSLYYSPRSFWGDLLANLYEHLLATEPAPGPSGAIHAVLMASRSDDPASTTWLYNHFADRFFGCHNDQDLKAWGVIIAGMVGSVVGALPLYYLGRRVEEERLKEFADRPGRWLTVSREDLERAQRWFDRHGGAAVLLCRLVPGVRSSISIPAGVGRMHPIAFLAYTAVGTALWAALLASLGYVLGESFREVGEYLDPVSWVVLGGIVIIYFVRVVRHKGLSATARRATTESRGLPRRRVRRRLPIFRARFGIPYASDEQRVRDAGGCHQRQLSSRACSQIGLRSVYY
jgi:membrane protein DedA with SNARE-associated domain